MPIDELTAEPTELLRTMIRNACVNDDTIASGQEIRNVAALEDYFAAPASRAGGSRPHQGGRATTPTLRCQRWFGGVDLRPGLETVRADNH